ncbi:PepSY-associated TM helix domain-containing protein [Pseudoteredinibacter isoporae]|uniref:PepSY-associated TM helix domain-containing protein n=1 Tax=Pseudoteredinibacter isoporae TaxID=570281 RepID=UPI0031084831
MKVNKTLWRWSRLLHIYAAVALLLLLLFFAFTGITLNHPSWFVGEAQEQEIKLQLNAYHANQGVHFSPDQIGQIEQALGLRFSQLSIEDDGDVLFFDAQMPGGFASGELEMESGFITASRSDFGVWAWMNDLHKGRHTGFAWKLLLDVSSVLILLFSISGLILLLPNRRYLKPALYLGCLTAVLCAIALFSR